MVRVRVSCRHSLLLMLRAYRRGIKEVLLFKEFSRNPNRGATISAGASLVGYPS